MESKQPEFLVIDCETTGIGSHDRIVEIALVTVDSQTWELRDEYDSLINPERDVGPTGLHGITASMVETAPTFSEVAAALSRRLQGSVLIAHNLLFDTRMLGYEFERLGVSLDVGTGLCTYRSTGEKLISACNRHGIELFNQHRALADGRATAALAREVFEDNGQAFTPVTVGYLPLPLNPRTLRREGADAGISAMARIVSLSYYPYSDESLLLYLDALDWVLDDHYIDDEERSEIKILAETLGIPDAMCEKAHRSYLASIIAAAKRDGIVTQAEQLLIKQVMVALEITDVALPTVTDLPETSFLSAGMRVCFTGNVVVDGTSFPRHDLEAYTAQVGMQPVASVTKKGCDLLVAADSSSRSGKARKAHSYGIPVMGAADFLGVLFSTR